MKLLNFIKKKRPDNEQQPVKERGYFDIIAETGLPQVYGKSAPVTVSSPEAAMRLAAVYRCTSILSGSIASLPLELLRKKNGVFMPDEAEPLNYLLKFAPNARQTAYELMRNAVVQMVNMGNAYIYPEWRGGEVVSLILLSPYSVSYDKILDIYMVNDTVNNIYKTLEAGEIIHLRNLSLDGGYTGVSTIRYASTVMGIAASADDTAGRNFRPDSTLRGFISGDADAGIKGYTSYGEDQLADVTDRLRKEVSSGEGINYIPGNMKFNPLSMSPADIQLMEFRKFSVLDICRFYGVHPDMAFAGQSQNYKASEMGQVQFMTGTLQPILRQIENEFFVKLVMPSVAGKYRIRFDLESYYQTDLETISMYREKSIASGLYTVNELRAKEGRPPVEGGDTPMISCNVAPINSEKIRGGKENDGKVPPTNGENEVK